MKPGEASNTAAAVIALMLSAFLVFMSNASGRRAFDLMMLTARLAMTAPGPGCYQRSFTDTIADDGWSF
jgi:hypothetical protein